MDCDGEAFGLDEGAPDGREGFGEACSGALHRGCEGRTLFVLNAQPLRSCDIKAVAAGLDELVEPDEPMHVRAVAATDDRHLADCGEVFDRSAHLLGEDR